MNIKKIQELVSVMNENDISEIELEEDGVKLRLVKRAGGVIERIITPAAAVPSRLEPERQAGGSGPRAAAPGAPQTSVPANVKEVKSPMVGTFYRAPSPDAAAYVQVGDTVHKGDVLCVVEAMKLMNEVKSELDGKVIGILIENAEPVEFGQTMFLIELA